MAVERRVHRTVDIVPEGDGESMPMTFKLVLVTEYQRRDGRQKIWLLDNGPDSVSPARRAEPIVEGYTRERLAELITNAAGWLAYPGEEPT